MANSSQLPSTTTATTTTVADLNVDSLAHCASYLDLKDISNMAMSCQFFRRVAYSDSIWQRFFREHWPLQLPSSLSQTSGVREAYLNWRTSLWQFKFIDPLVADLLIEPRPYNQLLLGQNDIIFSQGSLIQMSKIDSFLSRREFPIALNDHRARITCMRLFPLNKTSLFRSETEREENVLVTSSCDHSIRLWWKGSCQRCFRGHNGPVSTLSDKLLGDDGGKVFASGGEDGTVRLWSLGSSGKRGQHALKATLYGHEKPVKLMSVAGHRTSLLATIATDSKVRVWDTSVSSSTVRSSCCVGMTSVPGAPVGMKSHESLLYVAAGSSVVVIDLRTMQKVVTAAVLPTKLYSFEILPSKPLMCTGGIGKAMLWDIQRSQETLKPEPVAELDGHTGAVTLLHMDPYKVVTGCPEDSNINVWETETGTQTNSLSCCLPEKSDSMFGCSAMAVNGCRIVTTCCDEEMGLLRFRDFTNATIPVSSHGDEHEPTSPAKTKKKFWDAQSDSDTDTDSDTDSFDDYYF